MSELTKYDKAVTVALPDAAKQKLNAFWKAHSNQIASVTAGGDAERIMKVTYSLLWRTPKLIECTPFSLLNGIVLAHQLGLTFGTQEVALVPFAGEATLIIQYQGKIKLALASRLITAVHAEVVLAGEAFEYEIRETGVHFRHKPNMISRPAPDETNVTAAYCQLRTAEGGIQTRICPLWEILAARSRSRGYKYQASKNGTDNPWITDFQAMALKTAVHRAMKLAPQDARLGLATMIDDEDEGGNTVIADGLNPADFNDGELGQALLETGKGEQREVALDKILGLIQKPADGVGTITHLYEQLKAHGEKGEDLYARVMEANDVPLSPSAKSLTVDKAKRIVTGLWSAIELAKQPEVTQ